MNIIARLDKIKHRNLMKNINKNHSILEGLWEVLDEDKKRFVKDSLLKEVIWMFEFRVEFDKR